MGLKLYDTYEDKFMFPLSVKMLDSPGNIITRTVHNEFIFSKPSILLLCFDYSRLLNRQQIMDWTDFALSQVMNHHPSFVQDRIVEKKDKEKELYNQNAEPEYDDGLYMKNMLFDNERSGTNQSQDVLE